MPFQDKPPSGKEHLSDDDSRIGDARHRDAWRRDALEKKAFYSLDEALTAIEFPGSDPEEIDVALSHGGFADRIMGKIEHLEHQRRASAFWFIFSLANLAILFIFGASPLVKSLLLSIHRYFSHIFFFFLGLISLGGVIGLIYSIDTSGMTDSITHFVRNMQLAKRPHSR